ncbi:MAG: hypothetical protein AAB562_03410 [Patescibacteria group bacterium]
MSNERQMRHGDRCPVNVSGNGVPVPCRSSVQLTAYLRGQELNLIGRRRDIFLYECERGHPFKYRESRNGH